MFPSIRTVFPFEIPAPQTHWRYSGSVTRGSVWCGSAGFLAGGMDPHMPLCFDQALVTSPLNFSLFPCFCFLAGSLTEVLSLSSYGVLFPVHPTGVEILNGSACFGLRAQKAVASAHSLPCFYSISQQRHLWWV